MHWMDNKRKTHWGDRQLQNNFIGIGNVMISKTGPFENAEWKQKVYGHSDPYFDKSYTLRDDHVSEFFNIFFDLPASLDKHIRPATISCFNIEWNIEFISRYSILCRNVVLFYGLVLNCLFHVQENLKGRGIQDDIFRVGTIFQISVM